MNREGQHESLFILSWGSALFKPYEVEGDPAIWFGI